MRSYSQEGAVDLWALVVPLAQRLKLLLIGPLVVGVAALAASFLIPPTFTARAVFIPPQQHQSTAASALASLGALAGLAGGALGSAKSSSEQYVALMQSATVSDRIIDSFRLLDVYDTKFRSSARKELSNNVRISAGKRDGLIYVEVTDKNPARAADMANGYIAELRRLTDELALSDAQQRRVFFESQLKRTRDQLALAQQALEESGFTQGALRAEPKSAAESYARLKAEVTAAEVRLQALRRNLADVTPEVQQQQATVSALRAQLARAEEPLDTSGSPGYIGKYREFKYQETLFELFARQYELAKLDESREGALIQVVDTATPPDRKSAPKRALIAIFATLAAFMSLLVYVLAREAWRKNLQAPESAEKLARVRAAFRGQ